MLKRNWREQQKCSHSRIRKVLEGDLDYDESKDYLVCCDCGFLWDKEFQFRQFVRENRQYISVERLEELIRGSGLKAMDEMLRELEDFGSIW